jgi:hypothetical protein
MASGFSLAFAAALFLGAASDGGEKLKEPPSAWRNAGISYGQFLDYWSQGQASGVAWGHRLALEPEVDLGQWISISGRFSLEEDLKGTRNGISVNQSIVLSDLLLTGATPGIVEPYSGILTGGGVLLLLPTSQASRDATLQAGIGPSLEVSRKFPLLEGLTIGYSARMVFTFFKYAEVATGDCGYYCTGTRNAWAVLAHGPSLQFKPLAALTISGAFLFGYSFLRALDGAALPGDVSSGLTTRTGYWFVASVEYQILECLGIGVSATSDGYDVLPETAVGATSSRAATRFSLTLTFRPASLFQGL